MSNGEGRRLNKFISDSGYCSRREADKLILQNQVSINGKRPGLGAQVMPGDVVMVEGKRIRTVNPDKTDRVYIAYHKPVGITCTTEVHVPGNIIDAVGHKKRIFPVGRLDKDSEGLIFLTSDGDIVNKILRAENAHEKEYIVTVDKPLSGQFAERMAKGVPILGTVTKPCKVMILSRNVFKIILVQGMNRQIRRMFEQVGLLVGRLKRIAYGPVLLGDIYPGDFRRLSESEVDELYDAAGGSRSELAASRGRLPSHKRKSSSRRSHQAKKAAPKGYDPSRERSRSSYGGKKTGGKKR